VAWCECGVKSRDLPTALRRAGDPPHTSIYRLDKGNPVDRTRTPLAPALAIGCIFAKKCLLRRRRLPMRAERFVDLGNSPPLSPAARRAHGSMLPSTVQVTASELKPLTLAVHTNISAKRDPTTTGTKTVPNPRLRAHGSNRQERTEQGRSLGFLPHHSQRTVTAAVLCAGRTRPKPTSPPTTGSTHRPRTRRSRRSIPSCIRAADTTNIEEGTRCGCPLFVALHLLSGWVGRRSKEHCVARLRRAQCQAPSPGPRATYEDVLFRTNGR